MVSIFIWAHSLFRGQAHIRYYFLLMQTTVIIYLLGYLLDLTAANAEEAYVAAKILCLGAYLAPVFGFFFVGDYCDLKLKALLVKAPMVILSVVIIIAIWITKSHHFLFRIYPMFCMALSMAVLLYQMKKWATKYRKPLLVLFAYFAIPFVTALIHFISMAAEPSFRHVYVTPYSMAIMTFCIYIVIIRYDIFDIISIAAVTVLDHIREGFILVDKNNNYLTSNSAASKIFPWIKKLKKGDFIFSASGWPEELKNMENDPAEFSIDDNGLRYYRASVSPILIRKETLTARIILVREITDSVMLMKELENAATIDALTGLYNRKHFLKLATTEIERALRMNRPTYTAMLDLDFFKQVNDSYGHAAGDLLLIETAEIIRLTIRSYDLLGRYGGEEFSLLITDLEMDEAYNLMERIRENVEHSVTRYEGMEIKNTCSIGLAKYFVEDTLESSLRKADEALYLAKNSGRNQVQVYDSTYITPRKSSLGLDP